MDKFEELKEIKPIKSTCSDRLSNYICECIRKHVFGFEDKVISLFKTNTPIWTMSGWKKKPSKTKTKAIWRKQERSFMKQNKIKKGKKQVREKNNKLMID